jgi:hypothetical protein
MNEWSGWTIEELRELCEKIGSGKITKAELEELLEKDRLRLPPDVFSMLFKTLDSWTVADALRVGLERVWRKGYPQERWEKAADTLQRVLDGMPREDWAPFLAHIESKNRPPNDFTAFETLMALAVWRLRQQRT